MAAAPKGKATKAASWNKALLTLPSSILENETWDSFGHAELLKKMMDSLAFFTTKVITLAEISGNKNGDLVVGDKVLTKKQIGTLRRMLQEEYGKVQPIIALNSAVLDATYKTPMGLCWIDPRLREFFLGKKGFEPVDLGPAYEIEYSAIELQLMKKIGDRRRELMRQRFVKAGGDKNRPAETFAPPFEIPKSSDSAEHIFKKLERPVLEMVGLETGWSTAPAISALLSLYFRNYGLNVKTAPKTEGEETVRETPKVMFDERMRAFFSDVALDGAELDVRRKKAGNLFSPDDMTDRGIGYLQVIQRIVSKFTRKRKNLASREEIERYDHAEADTLFMERVQDGARTAVETKRFYKELTERENRAKPKPKHL